MKQSWVVAALIIFALSFSVFYPNLGWILRGTFFRTDTYNDDYQKLMREKEALEADLATRIPIPGTVEANTSSNTSKPVSAFVFSRYPFNFKNELLAAAGSEDGVHVGDTALVPIATGNIASSSTSFPGVLLGKVKQVYSHTSLIQTIYDASFESAVRIGTNGVDSLLKGGTTPRLTLIPLRVSVREGEVVYTASSDSPYGIPLGAVSKVSISADQVFNEATLELGYDINNITQVFFLPAK